MLSVKNVKKSVQQKVKESNLSAIFNHIAKNDGISRVDIAKRVGLSTSTVSTLTDELIHKGVVIETGEVKSGDVGRRAIRLQINPLGGFFVCVIFAKGEFQIDIYNLKEKLESSCRVNYSKEILPSAYLIDKIEENIEFGYKYGKFFGLLFIMPSWFNSINSLELMKEQYGYAIESDCFRTIKNFYKDTLVLSESSIVLSAHERCYSTSTSDLPFNVLHVNLDESATSCLIINGEKFEERKAVKDFGKMGVDFNAQDDAEKNGQLKTFITTGALISATKKVLDEDITFARVVQEFKNGNQEVVKIVDKACRAFAYAISNAVGFIEVKAVIVSGEVTKLGTKFKESVCKYLFEFDKSFKNVFIKFFDDERLVSRCGMYYVFDKVFDGNNFENAIAK